MVKMHRPMACMSSRRASTASERTWASPLPRRLHTDPGIGLGAGQRGDGQEDGDGREQPAVDQQRGERAAGGDHGATDHRAGHERPGEPEAPDGVALVEQVLGTEDLDARGRGQRPGGGGDRPVGQGQQQHRHEREVVHEVGQRAEQQGLDRVEDGQHDAHRGAIQPGHQRRRQQRREELGAQEEPRGSDRAPCPPVDEQRQREGAHRPGQLVEHIGRQQTAEGDDAQTPNHAENPCKSGGGAPHPISRRRRRRRDSGGRSREGHQRNDIAPRRR